MSEPICYSIDYVGGPISYYGNAITEYITIQAASDLCAIYLRFKHESRYDNLLHYDAFDSAMAGELPSYSALCILKAKAQSIPLNITLLFDVIRYYQGVHTTIQFLLQHENALKELASTRW